MNAPAGERLRLLIPLDMINQVFDLTFDRTFARILIGTGAPASSADKACGAYLSWLSPAGWFFWLFDGPMNTEKAVTALGTSRTAGLTRYTKESAERLTVRVSNLTAAEADAVATVYDSSSVYLLADDDTGRVNAVPVSIEPGSFPIRNSRENRFGLTVTITLPATQTGRY